MGCVEMISTCRLEDAKMPSSKQILVAIDDFQQARHLVDYVAELAAGGDDFKIHLFHAAGPLPPQLLESPGAEVRPQKNASNKSKFGNKILGSTKLAAKSNLNSSAKRRV